MFYTTNKLRHSTYLCTPSGRVKGINRTCLKANLFKAFRRFGLERRQPIFALNTKNPIKIFRF